MFLIFLLFTFFTTAFTSVFNIPIEFVDLDIKYMKSGYITTVHTVSNIGNFTRAKIGDFPWHATLLIKYCHNPLTPYPTYYSAIILNEKWIIAPANAIADAAAIRVDVGSVNINEPSFSVYPDAYTLHPEFNENEYENNIALLRLSDDNMFDMSERTTFTPIRLPRKRQSNESFTGLEFQAHISSYKFSESNSIKVRRTSEYLLTAKQTIIKNSDCRVLHEYFGSDSKLITAGVICAKSVAISADFCVGDAGTPLIVNEYGVNTLIGFLSSVKKDGNCDPKPIPAIFTRITKHFDWIARVTGYQFRP